VYWPKVKSRAYFINPIRRICPEVIIVVVLIITLLGSALFVTKRNAGVCPGTGPVFIKGTIDIGSFLRHLDDFKFRLNGTRAYSFYAATKTRVAGKCRTLIMPGAREET
jgi:hypothetical protein